MQILLNTPKIDSLSLIIELNQVEIINKKLTSNTFTYYESIEEWDEEVNPPKPIIFSENGITIRLSLMEIQIHTPTKENSKAKTPTKFIKLTISAKILQEYYFDGINKKNIKFIYDQFIDLNIFKCTFQTFIQSRASDIDICKDRYFDTPETFQKTINGIVQQMGTKSRFANPFIPSKNNPKNLGLDINTRIKAKPSLPYIKLYFKYWELQTKSEEFAQKFLKKYNYKNLGRVEMTIGNHAHRTRLTKKGILPKFITLEDLLLIENESLNNFLNYSINEYIISKPRKLISGLKPNDFMQIQFMQILITKGYDFLNIMDICNDYEKNSKNKAIIRRQQRLKKNTRELFDLITFNNAQINQKLDDNSKINKIYNWLGIKNTQ